MELQGLNVLGTISHPAANHNDMFNCLIFKHGTSALQFEAIECA